MITVKKESLTTALNTVNAAIPSSSTLEVLNGIKIRVCDEEITFVATNLEFGISHTVSCENDDATPKEFIIGPQFINIAKAMPDYLVKIEAGQQVGVSSGKAHFKLAAMSAEEYPSIPDPQEYRQWDKLNIDTNALRSIADNVAFAADVKSYDDRWKAVNFRRDNGLFEATATNTHRLAQYSCQAEGGPIDIYFNAGHLTKLMKLVGAQHEPLSIYLQNNTVVFEFGQTIFWTMLLNIKHPKFSNIWPDPVHTFKIDARQFLRVINRAALIASRKSPAISLELNQGQLEVSAQSDTGKMSENISVEDVHISPQESTRVVLNVRYLLDYLKLCKSDAIEVIMGGELKAVELRSEENCRYMVLPIKV